MTKDKINTANYVDIPVPPEAVERFKKWLDHYGMGYLKQGGGYWRVYYLDAIDLYWLGANMFSNFEKTGLHEPRF